MKKINVALLVALMASLFALPSCSEWPGKALEDENGFDVVSDPNKDPNFAMETDAQRKKRIAKQTRIDILEDIDKPENVALREVKATPNRPQVFVWFDNWNGESSTGSSSLRALPKEVTIASNWGGHPKFYWPQFANDESKSFNDVRKSDMEYAQKVLGMKVVVTLFSANCGDDMQPDPIYSIGSSSDPEVIRPAIKKYAEEIYDAVVRSGYDGFDWDYEPSGGGEAGGSQLWKNKAQSTMFIEELSYWFGAGAVDPTRDRGGRKPVEKQLLFLVDGEIGIGGRMDKDWLSYYIDYYVLQAYGSGTSGCVGRVSNVIIDMSDHIAAGRITKEEVVRRTILTENFESNAGTGNIINQQAQYVHTSDGINQQIGGFGIYRVAGDWDSANEKWRDFPTAIQKLYDKYASLNP